MPRHLLIWFAIALCLSQAALLSGLNLAIFSASRLRLQTEASAGDAAARHLLDLRRDANLTLAAIIWGNVTANVLLTRPGAYLHHPVMALSRSADGVVAGGRPASRHAAYCTLQKQ